MAAGTEPIQPLLDSDVAGTLVLLIDDEVTVREGIQDQMRRWRCEVISAGSGDEIIARTADLQQPPDLIVSDYRLRGDENGIMATNPFIPGSATSSNTASKSPLPSANSMPCRASAA